MGKPVILSVDDEPQVLHAVERDLRRRYRAGYRVITAASGLEALDAVQELKRRNQLVALFLVDQRMPEITGTDFLERACKLYPETAKVLLTAYADTEAAIQAINAIGLDYYLMKPWHPPEEQLYPILDDLLEEWAATVPVPYDGIRVAGTNWSDTCHYTKDFLARNRIPYLWLDIEKDAETRALVESIAPHGANLPVVFFPDGDVLVRPDHRILAEKLGLKTRASQPFYDMIIVGGGPAGLAAAVYAGSEGLKTALIEREATGGQAGTSSRIENYLGFPSGVSGFELARRATTQAQRFGVEILTAQETDTIRVDDTYRMVHLSDGSELACHTLLVATGVSVRKLDVPGAERLAGAGLYYGAAVTEAVHHEGQRVFVLGGANSAGQGAVFLARYAKQVTMLVRAASLGSGMSSYLVDQIEASPTIDVCLETEVVSIEGEKCLEGVTVCNRSTGDTAYLSGSALFVFIGAAPRTDMVAGLVQRDPQGFILTGSDLIQNGRGRPSRWSLQRDPFLLETNVPGIFAAGDVRHGSVKRVASAVGEGAITVSFVHKYLEGV